ncbi:unnamed protein product [Symbiodinium sp. CCMP2592]|nr:unnamed protein product [Symbiodinium sp. CCMP2592]
MQRQLLACLKDKDELQHRINAAEAVRGSEPCESEQASVLIRAAFEDKQQHEQERVA